MNREPDNLQATFDSAFTGMRQAREAFVPELKPREVGTIISIAIAKTSIGSMFISPVMRAAM